ncbi:MAG: prolipoprotein diacylglyceryl transferase [Bernardetiaceae bacterium]|nr:prolipoprotein diacylglyceryl transferase [Bernardetiaceae bacterium]
MFEKLKTRWGVEGAWQVVAILCVFALTGFSAMYIKRPIFDLLGITSDTPIYWRILVWLLTVLPAYQVLLLAYGFLFGQFQFFLAFEKRTFGRIASLFKSRAS